MHDRRQCRQHSNNDADNFRCTISDNVKSMIPSPSKFKWLVCIRHHTQQSHKHTAIFFRLFAWMNEWVDKWFDFNTNCNGTNSLCNPVVRSCSSCKRIRCSTAYLCDVNTNRCHRRMCFCVFWIRIWYGMSSCLARWLYCFQRLYLIYAIWFVWNCPLFVTFLIVCTVHPLSSRHFSFACIDAWTSELSLSLLPSFTVFPYPLGLPFTLRIIRHMRMNKYRQEWKIMLNYSLICLSFSRCLQICLSNT